MAILKCKMCGGDIELSADKTFGTCDSCGSTMTFPKVDDEQRANAFNRGNHFRRTGEFDKALAVYERIVQEDENDAEAHWCCALCRFGIEYVEDPNTFEYLPTCHRASFDSFLEDVDYLAALEHSDGITRRQYQKDAAKIAEVQRGILATSQNEEPFDVFICYKESENGGTRTRDSLMAQEIYYQLTEQGRRVFFSRITLEDKAGTEYEPYIFAALNSAKVMILVTTSAEHANAVWVKNEWSRFLSLMRKDRSKLLLPCYRDMDPYDLPEALSVLQSYDMSKIGFIQDLTRGVNKVLNASAPKAKETVKETVIVQQANTNAAPLLKRAFMFLEDGDFARADEFCEQVLNLDPENAEAYLGKLMAELHVKTRDALKDAPQPFDDRSNYKKAFRFGDDKLKEKLNTDIEYIVEQRLTRIYNTAINAMSTASTEEDYKFAASTFKTIPSFKDSSILAHKCYEQAEVCRKDTIYQTAKYQMSIASNETAYKSAAECFKIILGFRDASTLAEQCLMKAEECCKIAEKKLEDRKKRIDAIATALKSDGHLQNELTPKERLTALKTRVEWLTKLQNSFDTVLSQHSKMQVEQDAINAQETNLSAQRAKLGAFSGKEKKRIDEELFALQTKKRDISAQIAQYKQQLYGYTSKPDIERDITSAKTAVSELEKEISSNHYFIYSYDEALKLYLGNPEVTCAVNARLYPAISSNSIMLGRYVQKRNGKKEPIEWIVLEREKDRMLLISKYALDSQKYNTSYASVTWKTSFLRKWLNMSFLNNAFNTVEQNLILNTTATNLINSSSYSTSPVFDTTDKVSLLDKRELCTYFSSKISRQCQGTEYCCTQGKYRNTTVRWWLRSPGGDLCSNDPNTDFICVGSDRSNGRSIDINTIGAVRPVIWINIS